MAKDAKQRLEPALGLRLAEPLADAAAPHVDPYETVADQLRATREQYGEDLKSVAEALRIREAHLQAIEDGRYRDLPGTAYAIGFLRSYAEYLGLDGTEIVERFKEEAEGAGRKTQLVFPTPVPESSIPGGAIILISVLLLGAAYGAWVYFANQEKQVADLIPPVPEHLQTLIESGGVQLAEEATGGQPGATVTPPVGEPTLAGRSAAVQPVEEVPAEAGPQPVVAVQGAQAEATLAETAIPSGQVESGIEDGAGGGRSLPAASQPGGEIGTLANAGPTPALAASGEAPSLEEDVTDTPVEAMPATREAAVQDEVAAAAAGPGAPPAAPANAPAPDVTEESDGIPAAPQLATREPGRPTQVYGADNEDARIVLRAILDSWVQVRDGDEGLVMTRVLREGDSYRVPNQPGLTLLTGNAGGLEIQVDGQKLPPLGPVGAVRRNIALDPEVLINTPAPLQ